MAGEGLVLPAEDQKPNSARPVSYMAPEMSETDGIIFVERVTNAIAVTPWTSVFSNGWYFTTGTVARVNSQGIDVAPGCTANLILADGSSLTVRSTNDEGATAGIDVCPGETLNIFGQRDGTGVLTAGHDGNGACIGGAKDCACGTVTINGGTVVAGALNKQGSLVGAANSGAGIGGGSTGGAGTVTINGGTVTALIPVSAVSVGIGAGSGGSGGTVTINGGSVTTVALENGIYTSSPGIGFGEYGEVTINGGTVTARGAYLGPGIGSCSRSPGLGGNRVPKVTINGGTVTATGGAGGGAGIGGAMECAGCEVIVNGGRVTATGGKEAAGIGHAKDRPNDDGTLTLDTSKVEIVSGWHGSRSIQIVERPPRCEGGTVAWSDAANAWVVTPDVGVTEVTVSGMVSLRNLAVPPTVRKVNGVSDRWIRVWDGAADITDRYVVSAGVVRRWCEVTVGELRYMTAAWTSESGETNAVENGTFEVLEGTADVKVIFTVDPLYAIVAGEPVLSLGTVSADIRLEGADIPTVARRAVEYVDADGSVRVNSDFALVTAETAAFTGGWYLVEGTIERAGIVIAPDAAANLILADGASLTVTGADERAGIGVGSNETLTVYGQAHGTGRLTATGGIRGAGIGGGKNEKCGKVRIHGGVVTVTGGHASAGIGGGGDSGGGGDVVITGGAITAKATRSLTYIGGAAFSLDPGTVSVTGGIFWKLLKDAWIAEGYKKVANTDPATKDAYPWAVVSNLGPTCEGGEIEKGENGAWVVTPNAGVTEVTITGLPEGETLAVPPTVTKVIGVADNQVIVKSGEYDITGAFTVTGGAIQLNPDGVVTIDGKEIPVRPTIGDLDAGEPFVVGETAAVTVKAIPGLKYELMRAATVEAFSAAEAASLPESVASAVAEATTVTLTDAEPTSGAAFYRIVVSVP